MKCVPVGSQLVIEADRRVLERSCHKLLKMLDIQNDNLRRDYEIKKAEIDQSIEKLRSFMRNDEIIPASDFIDI